MPTFVQGQLCIPSDGASHNGALVDIVTGLVVANFTTQFNEVGSIIPGVGIALKNTSGTDGNLYLYDLSFSLAHTAAMFSSPTHAASPVTTNGTNTYWMVRNNGSTAATVKSVTSAGSVSGTTYTLTGTVEVCCAALSADGLSLYYADDAVGGAIKTLLFSGPTLSTLVAGRTTNQYGISMICLTGGARAGDFLIAVAPVHTNDVWQIERYTPAGVLAQTYPLPTTSDAEGGEDIQLSLDITYPNTFWVRIFTDATGNVGQARMYSLNGTLLQVVSLTSTADPNSIPPCCPLFGWSQVLTPAPPSGPFLPDVNPPPVGGTVDPIRRMRRFSLPFQNNVLLLLRRLEFLIQSGVGLISGQGSDPVMMVRISGDGGMTWSQELSIGFGKIGEFTHRAILHQLGQGSNFVVEVTVTDPVFVAFLDCFADLQVGAW